MAAYTINFRSHNGDAWWLGVKPEELRFSINLDQPHDISFQISNDEIATTTKDTLDVETGGGPLGTYQHDWHLLRNGVQIPEMAGMITSLNIPEGQEYMEITGKSWLHYLDRRHYPYNPTPGSLTNPIPVQYFNGEFTFMLKQVLIAILAKDYSLDIDLSDLGSGSLVYNSDHSWSGSWSRDTFKDNWEIDFGDSESILSKIATWAEGDFPNKSFDFGIDEDKKFWLSFPQVGDPNDSIWRFTVGIDNTPTSSSSLIHAGTTWTDSGPQGTHIVGTGTTVTKGNDAVDVNGDASSPRGFAMGSIDGQKLFRRLDFTQDFGNAYSAKRIRSLTLAALKAGVRPQREVPMQVAPDDVEAAKGIQNFWDLFKPGQYYTANIPLGGGHVITGTKKIISMECQVTNEGEEMVTIHDVPWNFFFGFDPENIDEDQT